MKRIAVFLLILLLAAGCQQASREAPAPVAEATAAPTDAPTAEPVPTEAAVTEVPAYAFTFTAQTLDGETVTEEFLGQYDLTMVNVWASWCGPCRGELRELGELYGKLPENVGFLSVTVDDPGDLQDARALLEENGCTFVCLDGLVLTEGDGFLSGVMAIPTTIFFDRSGNPVGEWIVGVPQGKGSVADAYLDEIQARLSLLNGR